MAESAAVAAAVAAADAADASAVGCPSGTGAPRAHLDENGGEATNRSRSRRSPSPPPPPASRPSLSLSDDAPVEWADALTEARGLVAAVVSALRRVQSGGVGVGPFDASAAASHARAANNASATEEASLKDAAAAACDAACIATGRLRAVALSGVTLRGGVREREDDLDGEDPQLTNAGGEADVAAARAWCADMTHGEATFLRAQCHRLRGDHAAAVRDAGLAVKLFDRATDRPVRREDRSPVTGSGHGASGNPGSGEGERGKAAGAVNPATAAVVTRADLVAGLCGDLRSVAAAADAWPPLRRQVDALLAGAEARLERAEARVAIADDAGAAAAAAEAYEAFDVLGDDRGRARARVAAAKASLVEKPWEAWALLLEAASLLKGVGDRRGAAELLLLRGRLMQAANDPSQQLKGGDDDVGRMDEDGGGSHEEDGDDARDDEPGPSPSSHHGMRVASGGYGRRMMRLELSSAAGGGGEGGAGARADELSGMLSSAADDAAWEAKEAEEERRAAAERERDLLLP